MKMDEMSNRFVREGFNVNRSYNPRTNTHTFTITRDGKSYSEPFDYRSWENADFRDARQRLFIIHMIDQFHLTTMFNPNPFAIKDVIFNDPATIVFWADGTKTVVKCQEGDTFDPEKGLAMAISKKALGNKREYYHAFLHWMKKYKEPEPAGISFDGACLVSAMENLKQAATDAAKKLCGINED